MAVVVGGVFHRFFSDGRFQFRPIPDAQIVFMEVGNPKNIHSTRTSANGRYRLEMPAGRYESVAAATGFIADSTFASPGYNVFRDGRPQTRNFFPEPHTPDEIVRTDVSIDVVVHLPDRNGGITVSERDASSEITFNLTRGTFDVAPIPSFRNEDGIAFEADISTRHERYDRTTRHGELVADVQIDPDARIFGQDVFVTGVRLSSHEDLGLPTFQGKPYDPGSQRILLVGEGRTQQGGRPRPFDDERLWVKLIITANDGTGLF